MIELNRVALSNPEAVSIETKRIGRLRIPFIAPSSTVAIIGDGSFHYYPQTMYTAARRQLDLTVVVPNNQGYKILETNRPDIVSRNRPVGTLPGTSFDPSIHLNKVVSGYDVDFRAVSNAENLAEILTEVLGNGSPTVVDVPIEASDA